MSSDFDALAAEYVVVEGLFFKALVQVCTRWRTVLYADVNFRARIKDDELFVEGVFENGWVLWNDLPLSTRVLYLSCAGKILDDLEHYGLTLISRVKKGREQMEKWNEEHKP